MATYPYGPKGAPAVGNGLGGLPRRRDTLVAAVVTDPYNTPARKNIVLDTFNSAVSGLIEIPPGYTWMRFIVIGAGGTGRKSSSSDQGGGGGGGFAATAPMKINGAMQLNYAFTGTASQLTGFGRSLQATNGGNALAGGVGGAAGIGTGGDINFNGGSGGTGASIYGGGGGAAGSWGGTGGGGGNGTSTPAAGGSVAGAGIPYVTGTGFGAAGGTSSYPYYNGTSPAASLGQQAGAVGPVLILGLPGGLYSDNAGSSYGGGGGGFYAAPGTDNPGGLGAVIVQLW